MIEAIVGNILYPMDINKLAKITGGKFAMNRDTSRFHTDEQPG